MGLCGTCKWRDSEGYCRNNEKIHEGEYDRSKDSGDDHLVYSYWEDGAFWVGPNFGCVHWIAKGETDNAKAN